MSAKFHSDFILGVFYFVKYVTWFLEFACWLFLTFVVPPGPRGEGNGDRSPALRAYTQYIRCCLLCLVQCSGPWSCRPQPRGAAERQPLARTQCRNLDRSLTLNVHAVCRVSCNPRGRPPWNRRTLLSAHCSRSMRQECDPQSIAAYGSRSAQHDWGRRPENRPDAHGSDRARTPRRATIPRNGRRRPKDRQVLTTLFTQTVSSRS